jgi:hypothetical protein
MATPRPSDHDRPITGRLRAQSEEQARQRSSSPFYGTGMHPNGEGGIDSDNYVAGVSGYSFGADGNAEFNDVTLRGALVGLDTPVQQKTYKAAASAFSLALAWAEKAGVTVTVPDGCTRASVALSGRMYAINSRTTGGSDGTGADALFVRVGVAGNFSAATPTGISGSNGFATTTTDDAFDLTGLTPGGTVRVSVEGSSGYQSLAAQADNYINVVASITWLR